MYELNKREREGGGGGATILGPDVIQTYLKKKKQ